MSSINRNKSKSKKSKVSIISEDKIDQIMKDITLKRPRNPYTQFVLSEVEQLKSKNKDKKIQIQELSAICAEKWKKLKEGEKKKFIKIYEEEKSKYKSDLELVRHYLFKDFNDTVRHSPTAYRIFLNEKLCNPFEQGLDPKEIKKEAKPNGINSLMNKKKFTWIKRKKATTGSKKQKK